MTYILHKAEDPEEDMTKVGQENLNRILKNKCH